MLTRADLAPEDGWDHLHADTAGNPCVWRNRYACDCLDGSRSEWDSEWSCQCDDECPECGESVGPFESEWIGPSDPIWWLIWEHLPEAGA